MLENKSSPNKEIPSSTVAEVSSIPTVEKKLSDVLDLESARHELLSHENLTPNQQTFVISSKNSNLSNTDGDKIISALRDLGISRPIKIINRHSRTISGENSISGIEVLKEDLQKVLENSNKKIIQNVSTVAR